VPHGKRVLLAFPGGAGFGQSQKRDVARVKHDLARGYISAEAAQRDYGLSADHIREVMDAVRTGKAM
jgi:N-methylhydantoinase B